MIPSERLASLATLIEQEPGAMDAVFGSAAVERRVTRMKPTIIDGKWVDAPFVVTTINGRKVRDAREVGDA